MAGKLSLKIDQFQLPASNTVIASDIYSLQAKELFDTIIYIDALEHIEKDKDELKAAVQRLRTGGKLIILSPAFNQLYSPFDKEIGHFRRYTKTTLSSLIPDSLEKTFLRYLDTGGFFLSLANRLLLKKNYPTQQQVNAWDRLIVPLSRIFDKILFYSFGKTILGVWQKK
jgi:hypothetical protein